MKITFLHNLAGSREAGEGEAEKEINERKETSVRHSVSQAFFMALLERLLPLPLHLLLPLLLLLRVVAALTTKVAIKRHQICVPRNDGGDGLVGDLGGSWKGAMEKSAHLSGRTLHGFFKVPPSGLG